MCKVNKKKDVRITRKVYYAYGEIRLIMRDVLERLNQRKYVEKTVKRLKLTKTQPGMFLGQFQYKDVYFFIECVGVEWVICLMKER